VTHGFEESSGSLYHLNAEDESKHPVFLRNHALKGVLDPMSRLLHIKASIDRMVSGIRGTGRYY
jgi:hypothetical protein